jgi:hypothetical protein
MTVALENVRRYACANADRHYIWISRTITIARKGKMI